MKKQKASFILQLISKQEMNDIVVVHFQIFRFDVEQEAESFRDFVYFI